MSITAIREAIAARIATVPEVGTVHTFARYTDRQADLKALFVQSDKSLRGWIVERRATRRTMDAVGLWTVTHTWSLTAWRSWSDDDASQVAFDDMVEAVAAAILTDTNLGGTVSTVVVDEEAGLQVEVARPVMFVGVLCHEAKCVLTTRHTERSA